MCGRYYVDDETSREIEKIVRKLDQRLKIEHGQDIHPSESAVILTKECKEVAARQMQWGFPGFQGKGLLINARAEAILDKKLLSDLREKGITILISSHILDELFRVATDYIFISQGTIKKNFTYEEIVHKYPDKMPEEIYLDILEECNALEYNMTLEGVKGITYKLNGNVLRNEDEIELTVEEMENTPYPAYELLPSSNPYTQLPVETSRGCRFSCAFCSIPHRRNWRGLSVEHVIKRVKHALQFKDNINRGTRLLFVDDCFTANGERAINVFKKLHRLYGYTEKVFIEARVTDILKNQILQNIPLQMVSSMQIGVECGYNEGLKKIRKGLTVEQLFSALEILKQYQFDKHCFLSFIIGFPWETMEMINKTLDTIELICTKYKIVCNLNWLLLLPSDLWWEKEDFNIHIEEDMFDNLLWYANSDYFFTTHPLISMEDIIQVEKRIGAMQRQGGTVAYRRRIGNEEDYIEPSACSE